MARKPRHASGIDQGTPDFRARDPLPLVQLPLPSGGEICGAPTQLYRLGECRVIVTRNPPDYRYHMSIAHRDRYPTWDEIAEARYRILPDWLRMALILPPKSEYVNLHPNCFQLMEVRDPGLEGV
jgi:hypothetical protein